MNAIPECTVSVVIPTFNGHDFIDKTLASVCRELLPGDEVIVVDDASTDNTVKAAEEVLERTCTVSWRVITCPRNLGPPSARNVGIRSAQGDVVMSIDQDDLWQEGHRRTLVNALAHCDIASGKARFEVSEAVTSRSGPKWWRESWLEEPQPLCEFGASAIKRRCFEEVGFLNESFRFGGDDIEWFARAQSAGLTRTEVPDVVLIRRIHGTNLSGQPQLRQELLDVVRYHLQRPK